MSVQVSRSHPACTEFSFSVIPGIQRVGNETWCIVLLCRNSTRPTPCESRRYMSHGGRFDARTCFINESEKSSAIGVICTIWQIPKLIKAGLRAPSLLPRECCFRGNQIKTSLLLLLADYRQSWIFAARHNASSSAKSPVARAHQTYMKVSFVVSRNRTDPGLCSSETFCKRREWDRTTSTRTVQTRCPFWSARLSSKAAFFCRETRPQEKERQKGGSLGACDKEITRHIRCHLQLYVVY